MKTVPVALPIGQPICFLDVFQDPIGKAFYMLWRHNRDDAGVLHPSRLTDAQHRKLLFLRNSFDSTHTNLVSGMMITLNSGSDKSWDPEMIEVDEGSTPLDDFSESNDDDEGDFARMPSYLPPFPVDPFGDRSRDGNGKKLSTQAIAALGELPVPGFGPGN